LREDLQPVTSEFYQSTYKADFQGVTVPEPREQPLFEALAKLPVVRTTLYFIHGPIK
jgi:hypothetical protein